MSATSAPLSLSAASTLHSVTPVRTFSIVAADASANECGVAVASKFLSVGAVVPWARAGVGAIATQSYANTGYGPQGLDLLAEGLDPDTAIRRLTSTDDGRDKRQVGIVDMRGRSASYSGAGCLPWFGGRTAEGVAVQGNILVSAKTVDAMLDAYQRTAGGLAVRLLAAIAAGEQAGGDSRGKQSAAILVVKPSGGYGGFNDRYLDLRVDDHEMPVAELRRVYELWRLYFEKPTEDQLVSIDEALAGELRRGLRRLGYDPGPDGAWDDRARSAFIAYSAKENLEERLRDDGRTDQQVLRYCRAHVERLATR